MNALSITFRNIRQRPLSSLLTIFSVAIGAGLVIAIMVVQKETERSFRQTTVPYNMILAAKGSPMQSYLNTIYHLETSTGIIPWGVYEAASNDPRVEYAYPFYVGDSYRGFRVIGTSMEFLINGMPRVGRNFEFTEGRPFVRPYEAVIGQDVARSTGMGVGDTFFFTHGIIEASGPAEAHVHEDTPVTVTGILRRTGTAHDRAIYTGAETTHAAHDHSVRYQDHSHADDDHEHGETRNIAHADTSHDHLENDHEPDHAHSHTSDKQQYTQGSDFSQLVYDSRGITVPNVDAVLMRIGNEAAALQLAGMINYPTPDNPMIRATQMRDPFFRYKDRMMAVIPAAQMNDLMGIVGNAETVLRIVAYMVLVVGLTGVLVAIFNTMDSRKRDIAVMRALGAGRIRILKLITLEAALITLTGCLLGFIGGHALVQATAPILRDLAGVYINAFTIEKEQITVLLIFIIAGTMLGLIPALKAYRTEVIRNLTGNG
jgi:putative ABC transport system permease protein